MHPLPHHYLHSAIKPRLFQVQKPLSTAHVAYLTANHNNSRQHPTTATCASWLRPGGRTTPASNGSVVAGPSSSVAPTWRCTKPPENRHSTCRTGATEISAHQDLLWQARRSVRWHGNQNETTKLETHWSPTAHSWQLLGLDARRQAVGRWARF